MPLHIGLHRLPADRLIIKNNSVFTGMAEPQHDKLITLRTRTLTAVVFVAVMLAGLLGGPWAFIALFTAIGFGAAYEFYELLTLQHEDKTGHAAYRLLAGVLAGSFAPGVYYFMHVDTDRAWPVLVSPLIAVLVVAQLWSSVAQAFNRLAALALSVLYIGVPTGLVIYMAFAQGFNPNIVFTILLLTWANDTGAYLIGMAVGRTPLWPRHSPKKTWEGTLGGLLFCLAAAYLIPGFLKLDWPVSVRLLLGTLVGVTGSLGDLAESLLKRQAGVKDSGSLMPGHGGLLDRFDAFIVEIPFVAAFLYAAGIL